MLHMSAYFNLYCFLVLCGLVVKTPSQHLSGNPIFYKYNAKTHKLRCNCQSNKKCDKFGMCSPDLCAKPYVGVNCQHASIEFLKPRTDNVPTQISDGNEQSCLSSLPGSVVRYILNQPINFVWVYISWKTTYHRQPRLTLYKRSALQTINKYLLKLNEKSVLIRLRQNVMYDKLELFDLPSDLCSLEISIGRNLAISSSPTQSSVFHKTNSTALENALRGIDGSDYQTYTDSKLTYCTHTQYPTSRQYEWWQTQLKYDALVNAAIILNRNSEQCRMIWALVEFFDSRLNVLYKHKINNGWGRYEIPVETDKWVRMFKITVNTYSNGCKGYGIVTVCEVYIYGELRCPVGMYGPMCDIDCPHGCPGRQKCDPDWGCTEGCNGRYQGIWCDTDCNLKWNIPNCDKKCSTTCASKLKVGRGQCNMTTGHCFYGCVPGYNRSSSPFCEITCPFPHFGQDCAQRCDNCKLNATLNVRRCHHVTGKCTDGCAPGFVGPDCIKMGRRLMYRYLKYLVIFLGVVLALLVYGWIKQARRNYKKRQTIFCCWNT